MNARSLFRFTCLALVLMAAACAQFGPRRANVVTMRSLIAEMTDAAQPARWPEPAYKVAQASSYDRKSVKGSAPDETGWFANADHTQFLRTENNGRGDEHVLLDVDGPGAIVRAWFTLHDPHDTLRIYIDNAKEPALQGTFEDLFLNNTLLERPLAISNGRHAGRHPGGLNLHLPIPYARHCKVTWSAGPRQSRYYNIEYRTYTNKNTAVQSFSAAQLKASQALLDRTALALLNPPAAKGETLQKTVNIEAGQSAGIDLPAGPGAVRALSLKLTPPKGLTIEKALRGTVIAISFDGKQTVWAPAGDFFGSGVGLNLLVNWYRRVDWDGTMSCRWVMPYEKSAKITLLNLNKQPVSADLSAACGEWKWDDQSLYFHADWRQERAIPTRPFRDWNYIEIKGKGVYMGDSLAIFNPVPEWWGEGDEKIYQDGAEFPTHFGTGSEDYYGYAWCSTQLFQGPFSNQVRCDGPRNQGHTVVTRVRSLDRIPFDSQFKIDIEVWNWNKATHDDYAVTTYWYGAPGTTCNRKPDPEEASQPISQVAAQ